MDDIQFPFTRKEYAGIGNPRYVSDIVAANQMVLAALTVMAGLGPTDFAIFGGMQFIPGSPNTYTAGYFYLNGVWYYQSTSFNELLYLAPNVTNIMSKPFNDSVSRFIYQVNYGQTTSSSGPTTSPQFSGNMNQYRLDLKSMGINIQTLLLATELQVSSGESLDATRIINFTNDKSIFCNSATVDTAITFDFTGAVPGTVIRLQWTWGAALTLTVTQPAGSAIILDSGDITRAASATNVMYFAYVGEDSSGNHTVSYTISQS